MGGDIGKEDAKMDNFSRLETAVEEQVSQALFAMVSHQALVSHGREERGS
jgi:hypothetical protein